MARLTVALMDARPAIEPDKITGTVTASAARVVVEYPFEFMVLQPVAQLVQLSHQSSERSSRSCRARSITGRGTPARRATWMP